MAAASDKARFYLEQSVPELKEWERKKIFAPEEISSVAKKRSDFEHKVNARGSKPSDYARYAEFEINVDTLRKKRVKRLGIRSTAHGGQRRIFFLYDRATKKFPGDLGLWMQSLEYTRKQRALKKVSEILTATLRLHPQKADLWIYAARFALEENGDMTEARSYMQRGLRFCKTSRNLWLEYTKLELLYISKIAARRHILGLDAPQPQTEPAVDEGFDADVISLLRLTAEDVTPSDKKDVELDKSVLEKFEQSPVLSGAIPLAIFDAAMNQFEHDAGVAKSFFDMVEDFLRLDCQVKILNHIVDDMLAHAPEKWQTMICHVKIAVVGLKMDSPEFPSALGLAVGRIREYLKHKDASRMTIDLQRWLGTLLGTEDLDPALTTILQSTRAAVERTGQSTGQ